jgi:hypothetical protein
MSKLKLVDHIERGPEWTTPLVIPLRSSWWSRLVDWFRKESK